MGDNEKLSAALREIGELRAALGEHARLAEADREMRCRGEAAAAQLAAIVEASDDAIVEKDLRGIVTGWNASAERMLGYSAAEIIGQPMNRLIPPSRQGEEAVLLRRIEQGEIVRQFESVRVRKDGEPLDVSVNVSGIRDAAGQIAGFSTMARDITLAKRTEKAQAASELRYRRLFETAQDGILILDARTGMVVDVNPFLVTLLGYSREEFLGKAVWELGFFRDIAANEEKFAELRAREYARYDDLPLETRDGHRVEVEFVSNVYLVNEEKVIQCNIRDISARKRAAAVLHESERFAQATIDALPAHICVLDESGTILAVNHAWRRFAAANQLVPQNVSDRVNYLAVCDAASSGEAVSFAAGLRAVLGGAQESFSLIYPCHSPSEERWFRGRATRFASAGPVRVVIEHENITTHVVTERQLRDQNEILSQSHEGVMIVNLDNRISLWNRGAGEILGWTPAEAQTRTPEELFGKDSAGDLAAMRAAVGREGFWNGELPALTRDGHKLILDCRVTLVHDDAGQPRARLTLFADITEKKLLERKFLRTQRLEAVGTLAGGIAHDLNNILAPMLMIAPMLKDQLTDPQSLKLLTLIELGAQRGANIIKQLLTFSRGIEGERGPVQPRHLLKEMVSIMRETFPREIRVRENMAPDLWTINADATQVHQVLLNLCVNARDALPGGGTISLEASNLVLGAGVPSLHPAASAGPYVRITVADTGQGIPPGNLDRIFEPFFTTKDIGRGTGLGLSTVLGIVKSHGGFITVYSEPGHGAVFKVHLPAIADATQVATVAAAVSRRGNQELILVVDDEAAIRHTLSLTLARNNYRVLAAANTDEAVKLFLKDRQHVRLVVTDIMMPGKSGVALIRLLRGLEPGLRFVAASGLHDEDLGAELAALGVGNFLAKPFDGDDLLAAVQRGLAARA